MYFLTLVLCAFSVVTTAQSSASDQNVQPHVTTFPSETSSPVNIPNDSIATVTSKKFENDVTLDIVPDQSHSTAFTTEASPLEEPLKRGFVDDVTPIANKVLENDDNGDALQDSQYSLILATTLARDKEANVVTQKAIEEEKNYKPFLKQALGSKSESDDSEVFQEYDDDENGEMKNNVVISYGCPADQRLPCVPKCCNIRDSHATREQSKKNGSCVPNPNYQDFYVNMTDCPQCALNTSVDVLYRYEYFIGSPCKRKKYVLEPENYEDDAYQIFPNGSLYHRKKLFGMTDYCVDTVEGQFKVFMCFESSTAGTIEFFHILYPVGQIISIVFLIATAATYLGIEQLRDLQGKSLVCHVTCLTVAFAFLATVQLTGKNSDRSFCIVSAFIIQFSFVACFFWLNVLSYDTYRNIRDHLRALQYSRQQEPSWYAQQHRSEIRQFVIYSIYAWITPLVLLVVSLVFDTVPGIPDTLLKPNFGVNSCWFGTETAALPYFFGPMGFLLAVNLVFFILSAYSVIQENKRDHREATRRESDYDQVNNGRRWRNMRPYIKGAKQCFALFIIMGLSWFTEIISWAVGGSKYIWVTTDIINTLQGTLIFIVFVVRPKNVREAIKARLSKWWGVVRHCDLNYQPPVPAATTQPRFSIDSQHQFPEQQPLTSFATN